MAMNIRKIAEVLAQTQPIHTRQTLDRGQGAATIEEERERLKGIAAVACASYNELSNQERNTRGAFSTKQSAKGMEPIELLVEAAKKKCEAATSAYLQYDAAHPIPTEL